MDPSPTHRLFTHAARALSDARAPPAPDVATLLDRLGYAVGDPDPHRAALLRAAANAPNGVSRA